ncbi:MAG: hypothetical protein JWO13_2989 [Acidobacteriales bacterium]|nr:hypothetical protein [Terriglobales bacterium]
MRSALLSVIFCAVSVTSVAQQASAPVPNKTNDVEQLRNELQETRTQLSDSVRQIEELRRDLDQLKKQLQPTSAAATVESTSASAIAPPSAAAADQDPAFLASKVTELHQVKVESAGKYPVKLSGLILFNAYHNNGNLDLQDQPNLAFGQAPGSPRAALGATLRQTLLGIEAKGPDIFGAQTSADVSIDFFGGSPQTTYGITAGLLRLRTANVHLNWDKTTLNIGQDTLFISPLSPTSYASIAEPAFSWAGNLWVWTPQIMVEHRFTTSDDSALVLQGGILDPLTEEVPPTQGRTATAGERSGYPAIAGRIALDRSTSANFPFTIGFAGYRGQQRRQRFLSINNQPAVTNDSWTVNADFKIPIANKFELSGEYYTGQAVGGLGGGIWSSVIYPDFTFPHAAIHPLHSAGGWAQLKFMPAPRFEINAAMGQDENVGTDVRFFASPVTDSGFFAFKKNRAQFVNFIYKPNSILLFSLEYRRLFTLSPVFGSATGNHINVAAGVRF